MTTPLAHNPFRDGLLAGAVVGLGLLAFPTAPEAAVNYGDVGSGPFGSMSWVSRDDHFWSTTRYDGGPMRFLSSESASWHHSYADATQSGEASNSLLDGSLHVSAAAGAWGPNATNHSSAYRVGAGTAMWDRITVRAGEGSHLIPLSLRVDGSVSGSAGAKVRFYVGPNKPFTEFANQPFQGWRYLNGNPGNVGTRDWDTTFELGSLQIDAAYELWPLNVYFEIDVFAYSARTSGGHADFSHTARFIWDLPETVTVSSASGQFMTAPLPPVPEPSTAALAFLGLALLPAMRRRSRQGPVSERTGSLV